MRITQALLANNIDQNKNVTKVHTKETFPLKQRYLTTFSQSMSFATQGSV